MLKNRRGKKRLGDSNINTARDTELLSKTKSKIVGEIVEEREKNVKRFLKDDGSYQAVIYKSAVHYKEGNSWKDIDNSLAENVDIEDSQNVLENKQNSFKIKLAKNTMSKKLVKIKKGNYELSWGIYNASNSFAQVKPKDINYINTLSEEEKKKTLTNISSTVDFKDVYQNIDFRYNIMGDGVKEEIVIKNRVNNPIFRFNMELKNLVPKLSTNNTIIFYDINDTSKQIFSQDAPFMYDANGEESKDIQINIQQSQTGYVLTITPNNQWINSSDRFYPIVIDPSIRTSLDATKIYDAHVTNKYPTTNYLTSTTIRTGLGSTTGLNRTYIAFELPTMNAGDLITNVKLDLAIDLANTNPRQTNVHKVLVNWNSSTITWNNKPAHNPKIEDYQMVYGLVGEPFRWDITSIAKEWYSTGNNYGLMLKNHDESVGYNQYYSSDSTAINSRPLVTIDYVNNSGLESYWTYHSQDIGRAGTGYVNDYNGNFVLVHDDLEMNGNRMPVTIKHVFNSNEKNTGIKYGLGWRLNLSQRLVLQVIDGREYYVYTDEDGTKHYLVKNTTSNIYEDESGLNITMTIDSSTTWERFKLKDKGGNELSFSSTGYLTVIKDNNGNIISLVYTGTILNSVVDGIGRVISFKLDEQSRLSGITDPSGRITTYSYDTSNRLSQITYPDGKYSLYSYDTRNNITSVTNFDGYKMTYTYYDVAPYRMKRIQESHVNGTLGEELNIAYGYNLTSFTDSKNRKTIYQFNNEGNTISIKDSNGSAQYYEYFKDGGRKNKLETQSKLQKTVLNYLLNHNLEQSNYWFVYSRENSTANVSYVIEDKYMGNQSLKLEKTNTLGSHSIYQTVTLEKGKTYTLSGYIKTKDIPNVNGKGAVIFVSYQNGNGTWTQVYSDYVTGTKQEWDRYEVKFTFPIDAMNNTVHVELGIVGVTGIAYFDCIQLENGSIANRYNLIENPDFRYGTDTPEFWAKSADCNVSDTLTTVTGQPVSLDNKVFRINGEATKRKNLVQTINVSVGDKDTIVIGGWAKGDPIASSREDRYFGISIGLQRPDGSYKWDRLDFNEDSTDWQYASKVLKITEYYKSIKYYIIYYNNANTVYFDGLQLYKEEFGESYMYDSNGNIKSITDLSKQESTFQYNSNNDLIKAIDPKGSNFNYSYDSKHNLLNATSAENVVYSFTYDSYGNPLTAKVGDANLFIESISTYTNSGNYIKTLKDSEGNAVTYNYDENKGTLDSIVDPKGNITSYSYDNVDRLQSVSKIVDGVNITNSYSYENDKLKAITHNVFSYNFGYDSLGNNTTISVGNQNLITNIYEAITSKLLESKYGNNQRISYAYDNEDRIISENYIDNINIIKERYRYEYDGNGNIGYHEDFINYLNYRYIYDLADRLVKIIEEKSDKSNKNITSYEYDVNNNISNFIESINNNSYTTSYGYDKDNRPASVTTPKGKSISYQYDTLGRVLNNIVNSGSIQFNTKYSYVNGINGVTTTKIASIDNGGNVISYTYDKNSNIETINENGRTIKYYYNELNELIKEEVRNNQGLLETTINYSYDAGGNILKKEEYTRDSITPIKIYNYTYGDPNWKDKLTNFDGREITYDEIGNPLTYNGWTFNWEEGRQLVGLSVDGLDIIYKYNSDGARIEKIVDGVITKYHVVDSKVTFETKITPETNETENIYYTYDISDSLVSIELNEVEYYYVRNAQGDIIGLIDSDGVQVVTYTYDSWGKPISVEGSLKDTLGIKNPYRYRGYRYDNETGLYYLQSRYYNYEWGRFINADDIDVLTARPMSLTDKNLFSYCDNNPIMRTDEGGYIWANILIGAGVGAAISVGSQLISGKSVRTINLREVGGAALAGAIASTPGLGFVGSSMVGGVGNVVGGYASGNIKSTKDAAISFVSGAAAGGAGYSASKAAINSAAKTYARLPRYAKKTKLKSIYSNKGNARNINLKRAKLDKDFRSKLAPGRSFIYSTASSEFSGRLSDYSLKKRFK
jgi:RHS repeat-associated protein